MSATCTPKEIFNRINSEHIKTLINVIDDTYEELKYAKPREKISTSDFLDLLKTKLQNTPFQLEYSTTKSKQIKDSYLYLTNIIKEHISQSNTIKLNNSEINVELHPQNFINLFNLSKRIKLDYDEQSIFEIGDQVKNVKFKQFLYDKYGDNFGAVKRLQRNFTKNMFFSSVIDFKNKQIITSSLQLNQNIRRYKKELFKTIVEYLNIINPDKTYSENMYYDRQLSNDYEKVLSDMSKVLNDSNSKELISQNFISLVINGNESKLLKAIDAYTTLLYFDSMIQEYLGKFIKFENKYKNKEVGEYQNKYRFNVDTEHHIKNWNDNENKSAAENTSRFSKFVLDSIPLIINGKETDLTVGITAVNKVFSKLFNNSQLFDKEFKDLSKIIWTFHNNPLNNAYDLMELIATGNGDELTRFNIRTNLLSIGFTNFDLGVIDSLHKYIFGNSDNSSREIEFEDLKINGNFNKFSIIQDIAGVIDDCMDATYLVVEYGIDGGCKVYRRPKYKNRNYSEKFKDSLNAFNIRSQKFIRDELKKGCTIRKNNQTETNKGNLLKVTATLHLFGLKDFDVNLEYNDKIGVLTQINTIKISSNDNLYKKILKLFDKDTSFDFSDEINQKNILSYKETDNEDCKIIGNVLQFIDDRLNTKFMTKEGLKKFSIFFNLIKSDPTGIQFVIEDLFLYSIKSQIISDIYGDFYEELNDDKSKYQTRSDFIKYLENNYGFNQLEDKDKDIYYIINNGITYLKTLPSSTQWVDTYANAYRILLGQDNSSVSKNQSNNNDANSLTSFLGGQIFNICYNNRLSKEKIQRRIDKGENIPQLASSPLLFTTYSSLINNYVIDSDIKNRHGDVKAIRDLTASELIYHSIIHNFWGHYISSGEYAIQPTTYSDKVKLIQYMIDAKKPIGKDKKSLDNLSNEETIEFMAKTVGQSGINTMENILYKYRKIFNDPNLDYNKLNDKLKTFISDESESAEEKLLKLANKKGIDLARELDYRIDDKTLKVNEIIPYIASYSNIENLTKLLKSQEIIFINNIINSGVNFYIEYFDSITNTTGLSLKDQYDKSTSPVANIIKSVFGKTEASLQKYHNKWVYNGKLILGYDNNGNMILNKNITSNEGIKELNPLLEKFFYMDALLSNNLRLLLTGFETNHPDKSKYKKKYYQNVIKGLNLDPKNQIITNEAIKNPFIFKGMSNEQLKTYSEQHPEFNLNQRDLIALRDLDVYMMFSSNNSELKKVGETLIQIITNISQSTQFKRNITIPGTMHYIHKFYLNGVSKNVKVAIIEDEMAIAYNFRGDSKEFESMDGSSYTTMEQSIMENNTLGSQSVGQDKKPLWHYYDKTTSTSGTMKFASFVINNARMKAFDASTIQLRNMYKKMTNLKWNKLDINGNIVDDFGNIIEASIDLTKTAGFGKRSSEKLDFNIHILSNNQLFYSIKNPKTLQLEHRSIINFGKDSGGYYTIEQKVTNNGLKISNTKLKVYHHFDSDSNHITTIVGENDIIEKQQGLHNINSNYELWLSMGGMYSESLNSSNQLEDSESSHYAVVGFMNRIMIRSEKANNNPKYREILTQEYYYQPLKQQMIGYLTNLSAMKNGTKNINSVKKWHNNEDLFYFHIDIDGLGIQMDADHDVETGALMTEFSQVIAALESGGYLHKYSKQIYSDLERVANKASELELQVINDFISGENTNYEEVKSKLYELISKTLINGVKSKQDTMRLTDDILNFINKYINKNLDHSQDLYKIPFSDPNIYGQILTTLTSVINKKSIKRKFPGSGMVMVPAYNIVQYFYLNGQEYLYQDVVELATEYFQKNPKDFNINNREDLDKKLVEEYLNIQQKNKDLIRLSVDEFIPSDIVDIMVGGKVIKTLNLDDQKTYYAFKDYGNYNNLNEERKKEVLKILKFKEYILPENYRYNITVPKNLAPSKITFRIKETKRLMNVFDIPIFRKAFENSKNEDQLTRQYIQNQIQKTFRDLDKGFYMDGDKKIYIYDLQNLPAEMVISNMNRGTFNVGNASIAKIKKEKDNLFKYEYSQDIDSDQFEVVFASTNPNENIYLSFNSPKKDKYHTYNPYKESHLLTELNKFGEYDVYLIDDNNHKLFKVGRYVKSDEISLNDKGEYINKENKVVNSKNLLTKNGVVYKYFEFVSQYTVNVKVSDINGNESFENITKYYINLYNINECFKKVENDPFYKDEKRKFINNILNSIYYSKQFIGIIPNKNITKNGIDNYLKYYSRINVDKSFKSKFIDPLIKKISTLSDKNKVFNIEDDIYECIDSFCETLNKERYTSWLQSLYYTAARIPAQTLQSFMQMRAIAYTGDTSNTVYVSHWQAWLQGSDYDIDKSYIMGQEFGDDGRLIKYSNLFDYGSLRTLQASLWLPTPRNIKINRKSEFSESDSPIEITLKNSDLEELANMIDRNGRSLATYEYKKIESNTRAKILRKLADMIIDIYDICERRNASSVYFSESKQYNQLIKNIVDLLQIHEKTKISPNLEEAAYKNSVSAGIKNIVQHLANMDLAYSPITMDDLQKLAERSAKGAMTAAMSMLNPLTKYLMQIENMTGKKVIGITAVGEKVFFNLSYYYNEGIKSQDENYLQNLQFNRTFNRIQDRFNYNLGKGSIKVSTKTKLANVNFENFEDYELRFISINHIDSFLRKKYNITDEDILNQSENVIKYLNEKKYFEENKRLIDPNDQKKLESDFLILQKSSPVDLLISQLLSAATDNAKELILKKINCDSNFARFHLYLLMLGFDIKDVVSFMTSPCVDFVSNIVDCNFLDSYITKMTISDAINIADGLIRPEWYLNGTVTVNTDFGSRTKKKSKDVYDNIKNLVISNLKNYGINTESIKDLKSLLQVYIKAKVDKKINYNISNIPVNQSYQKQYLQLCEFVEKTINQIIKAKNQYKNKEDYDLDLQELKNIEQLSDEISVLGNTLLGMNQGLPGTKSDLLSKLNQIKNALNKREKIFNLEYSSVLSVEPKENIDEKKQAERLKSALNKINQIIDNNEFISKNTIYKILNLINAFGIIDNFNIEYWLLDKQLTKEDIVNEYFLGKKINIDSIFLNNKSISYRKLISDYYNIIKGTFNIFDVVDKVPHYRSIIELLKTIYYFDKNISIKSNLINQIYNNIIKETKFIDDKQNKKIINYVEWLLVTNYFNEKNYKFPTKQGLQILNEDYNDFIVKSNSTSIDLNTPYGRASFKKVFEDLMINFKRSGEILGQHLDNYLKNEFLQAIDIIYDKNQNPSLTLEMIMSDVTNSSYSELKFQRYLDGLKQLENIKLNGISLVNWLMLYNLYVNQNQLGNDRFTAVFKSYIFSENSVLKDYYDYISKLDYKKLDSDLLSELGYDLDDVLISIAPIINKNNESIAMSKYILIKENGEYVLKRKTDEGYVPISKYPFNKNKLVSLKVSDIQKSNYDSYQTMPLIMHESKNTLKFKLLSDNKDIIYSALQQYLQNGLLTFGKDC